MLDFCIGVVVLLLITIAVFALYSVAKVDEQKHQRREKQEEQMHEEFRAALRSRDYRKLDDFVALWADWLSAGVLREIKIRRDELYIEANDKE